MTSSSTGDQGQKQAQRDQPFAASRCLLLVVPFFRCPCELGFGDLAKQVIVYIKLLKLIMDGAYPVKVLKF